MHSAREKILEAAVILFYRDGYWRTGVNRLVEEAGVTKATFYAQFSSKEDLCIEYIREMDRRHWDHNAKEMERFQTPEERFLGPLQILRERILDPDWRGSPFQNLLAELPDPDHPAVKLIQRHQAMTRQWLRGLTLKLKSSGGRFRSLNEDLLSETYLFVMEGLYSLSAAHRADTPVGLALRHMKTLAGI